MANSTYETHTMPDPYLPFIFHRDTVVTQKTNIPNWHENIEVLYCVGGSGTVKCDQFSIPFCCGDVIVVNTEMLHAIVSDEMVHYHCLIIDKTYWESNGIPVSKLRFQTRIRDTQLSGHFEQVHAAYIQQTEESLYAVAKIRHAVLGLMCALCNDYVIREATVQPSAASVRVKRAMSFIRSHLHQPITLDAIAAHVGISKFYLAREFKQSTGMTVIAAVNATRCVQAKRLIEEGMRVSAAAQSCGFENMSYFSRTFKKQFGVLPSAFSVKSK